MFIWVRWMWPRFRYDQLMDLGWRRFIPLALANIVVTAVIIWWADEMMICQNSLLDLTFSRYSKAKREGLKKVRCNLNTMMASKRIC